MTNNFVDRQFLAAIRDGQPGVDEILGLSGDDTEFGLAAAELLFEGV